MSSSRDAPGQGRHWQQAFAASAGNQQDHAYQQQQGQSPTMTSSATFSNGVPGAAPPHRPARSVRRPAKQQQQQQQAQAAQGGDGPVASKASKLAQAIQRDERERERERGGGAGAGPGGRPGSRMSFRSASPTGSIGDHDLDHTDYSNTRQSGQTDLKESPVLNKAVSAFASAGNQQARSNKGKASPGSSSARPRPTDRPSNDAADARDQGASSSSGRNRRGAVGVQGESARARKNASSQQALPSNPAFREMERVLEQVGQEWPELLPPGIGNNVPEEGEDAEAEDMFDPVTLALSLVDPEAAPDRFRSFLATKEALSRSLKHSIQTHYRTFDASVSSYNGLLSNISHAQKNAGSLRTALEDVREMLGKGRAELGVLEARRTELNEIDKILVAIETLKNVPDKLETLMSEKRFLAAAVLLVRSLKMINKQDLREVQATADLRAYFVSQENLMLDFLTEELHNHLYLKSFYTESRWKPHTQGQTELPAFVVEATAKSVFDLPAAADDEDGTTSPISGDSAAPKKQQTKLAQFLARLAQRPGNLPSTGEAIDEGVPLEDLLGQRTSDSGNKASIPRSGSVASITRPGLTPSPSASSGLGIATSTSMSVGLSSGLGGELPSASNFNPEQDSFAYIETILESLAYLGKLGHAMDTVLQRAPIEIYNLVEGTVVDVDERNDPIRRNSIRLARFGVSPKMLLSGTFGQNTSTTAYSLMIRSSIGNATTTAADETGLLTMNTEILLDFFWTLFSKLDAILQGFRVLHEVVQRIVGRKNFKDGAVQVKSGGALFSLYDVWRPVSFEIQALLHDYLVVEQNGNSSSRSAVASINETLRLGRPVRDPSKSLFKFSDTDSKTSSRRIKPYEDSLNRALRESVPGLVSSLAEGSNAGLFNAANSKFGTAQDSGARAASRGVAAVTGRTHHMLVPPNAFQVDSLVLPTMKFLERAKSSLPDGMVNLEQVTEKGSRRYSGIIDDETMEKLGPAIDAYSRRNSNAPALPKRSGVAVNGS